MKKLLKTTVGFGLINLIVVGQVLAQCNPTGVPFGGGDGSGGDPYQICSATQLNSIGNSYTSSNFQLESNIDLSGIANFNIIESASGTGYTGTFDGQGFTISNLTIESGDLFLGLFGALHGTVRDLKIKDGSITITAFGNRRGLLAGHAVNASITDVNVSGSIIDNGSPLSSSAGLVIGQGENTTVLRAYASGTISSGDYNGGIAGRSLRSLSIQQSTALINLTGGQYLGGIIGHTEDFGAAQIVSISDSLALGSINATGGLIGGVVGYCGSCAISKSYAQVGITTTGTQAGGIAGYSSIYDMDPFSFSASPSISSSYSTGAITASGQAGGAVGQASGTNNSNVYWDIDSSGLASSAIGTGLTTSQAKSQANYTGFDFTNDWQIDEGNDYPRLRNNVGLPTSTPTQTATFTASNTATNTSTPSSTATATSTSTQTATLTASNTATSTSTNTFTPGSTPTNTAVNTPTVTPTPIGTLKASPNGEKVRRPTVKINGRIITISGVDSFAGPRNYFILIVNTETGKKYKSAKITMKNGSGELTFTKVPLGTYRAYLYVNSSAGTFSSGATLFTVMRKI